MKEFHANPFPGFNIVYTFFLGDFFIDENCVVESFGRLTEY